MQDRQEKENDLTTHIVEDQRKRAKNKQPTGLNSRPKRHHEYWLKQNHPLDSVFSHGR